jgi:FMN phosphatase YigB (HAD superfamily)
MRAEDMRAERRRTGHAAPAGEPVDVVETAAAREHTAPARDDAPARPARTAPALSFDVFDTVLMRRCTTPDGVFELACRHAGAEVGRPGLVESFVQHRKLAETTARRRVFRAGSERARNGGAAAGASAEVTIEAIYREFPRRLFGLETLSPADLAEAEFRAELDLCVADPEVAFLYDEARDEGFRTGFVSDTYWGAERLARLLRHCRPGLAWDFLYASCDHGTAKADRLFEHVLAAEGLDPAALTHMGDNPVADVTAPRRLGIGARPYAQATPWLAGVLQREEAIFALTTHGAPAGRRLDAGARTLRRRAARTTPVATPAAALGLAVLGPVLAAFDRFVEAQVRRLDAEGRRVAVAFLARDGALSRDVWTRLHPDRPAAYLEINRRTAALAVADGEAGFAPLLDPIDAIDRTTAVDMLGLDAPALRRFFATEGGVATGPALAAALPRLFGRKAIADLAGGMRDGLLAHLRREIDDFDALDDLVLVDLGYSGSVQKGLRRALDLAVPAAGGPYGAGPAGPRLHGVYLVGKDAALDDLGPDTASSFVSDLVVSPHVKAALLGNIAVLEQLCGAPTGSVRAYRDGLPLREPERRDAAHVALAREAQAGALRFAEKLAEESLDGRPDPFAERDTAAAWTAALLARLLFLPTDDEILLLGGLAHDVNLGSRNTVALADPQAAANAVLARALPEACAMAAPPMWPAGSLAALSPLHGFAYALFGAGALPGDVFGDVPCGRIDVTLVGPRRAVPLAVTCLRTPAGDLRLRVPLLADRRIEAVAVPVGRLAARALLRGVTLQEGETGSEALREAPITTLGGDRLQAVGGTLVDELIRCTPDGSLVILVPKLAGRVAVLTLVLTPLGGARPLALSLADQAGEAAATSIVPEA